MSLRRSNGRLEVVNSTFGWCTVTQLSPLQVAVDGSPSSVNANVNAAGAAPAVGDRLMWTMVGKQLVLIGDPRPVGEIMQSSVSLTPPNSLWLLADGSSVLRTTYPKLNAAYSAAGYPWGTADGTHFNLPGFHLGAGTPNPFPRPGGPGSTGGSTTHSHSLSPANGQAQIRIGGTGGTIDWKSAGTPSWTADLRSSGMGTGTPGNNAVGAGLTGNTDSVTAVPPYAQLAYFVKAA